MESKQNILLVIALVVLVAVLYWYFQYGAMTLPQDEVPNTTEEQQEGTTSQGPTAVLSVVTDKESYRVGDAVALSFFINTDVPVDGADVIFLYDSNQFELVEGLSVENFSEQVAQASGAPGQVIKPTIQFVKSTKEGNKVRYSFAAIALPGQVMQGRVNIGTVTLRAKKAGEAPITFSFEKGLSTDSNIAYEGRDILQAVEGTTVRVQNAN